MDPKKIKLFDMSLSIYHGCPSYPKLGTPAVTRTCYRNREGFNAERLEICTHVCTHVDTPEHFFDDAGDGVTLPLERFWGPGAILDLRGRVVADQGIGLELVRPFGDMIEAGDFVLINTGWNKKRGFSVEYMRKWPWLDGAASEFFRDKGVKAVGIDSISLGGYGSREKAQVCHEVLLGAGILIIEEVFFPDEVMDGKKRLVSAFPLKIVKGSASPIRLVAYEEI
ncbi:MAG: cyclase family protein [Deltaproteobacteria bacterium]|jgi:kynurenine formamidase|nr:cyclase family protein [Deltaproteobacteria bacterium]